MSDDEKKGNPGGTGMVVAGLLAVFVGLWMVGQTTATEGELIKHKLNDIKGDVETLTYEMEALNAQIKKLRMHGQPTAVAAAEPAEAAPAAALAEPAAEAEAAPAAAE